MPFSQFAKSAWMLASIVVVVAALYLAKGVLIPLRGGAAELSAKSGVRLARASQAEQNSGKILNYGDPRLRRIGAPQPGRPSYK